MACTVQFSGSPVPAVEDAVWILELLSEAVHRILAHDEFLNAYEEVEISAVDVSRILGNSAAQYIPGLGASAPDKRIDERIATLKDIWDGFLRENRIKKLDPKIVSTFERERDETIESLRTGTFSFDYLERANDSGHTFVKAFLKKEKLDPRVPGEPVGVFVLYDPNNTMYCAASDRFTGSIRWAHQVVPHALSGMVLADRVLAHEYLSHLAPESSQLSRAVLERWLVALLKEGYWERTSEPAWKSHLWTLYRNDLETHVAGLDKAHNPATNQIRCFGYAGLEETASSLYLSVPRPFWRMTSEMLQEALDDNQSRDLDGLLVHLVGIGPRKAKELLATKWKTIEDLQKRAGLPGTASR